MVTKTLFDNYEGRDVYLYTLDNGKIKAGITDFGGILNFLEVGGRVELFARHFEILFKRKVGSV